MVTTKSVLYNLKQSLSSLSSSSCSLIFIDVSDVIDHNKRICKSSDKHRLSKALSGFVYEEIMRKIN